MTAAYNSKVAGSVTNNRQDLAYIGEDNRIYVLDFVQAGGSNPWSQWDIIAFQEKNHQPVSFPIPGVSVAHGGCPLAVIPWEPSGINGLVYMGNSNGQVVIETLTLDMPGLQVPNTFNLTELTKTENYPPMANSQLVAYTWQKQQSLHVIYVDSQGHVRELYRVGAGPWYTNDLSALTGYTGFNAPKNGSPVAGYVWENQGTEHVVYIAQDNSIRELYYSGGRWYGNNLSAVTQGALPPVANSPLAAYACEYENTQHVIYFNYNGDVQELYYSDGWKTGEALNLTAGASKPAANSALAGYAAEYERTEHVVYIDDNSVIHELYHTGSSWLETLLLESAGSNATAPREGTPLAGYAYLYGDVGTQHVIYIDSNNNVHELYREGNAWYSGVVSGSIQISS
jgi:Fungal fucose-specific lectin